MNLYLISQGVNNGYDTYDSAVVAAESEERARFIHPSTCEWLEDSWRLQRTNGTWIDYGLDVWTHPDNVTATLIGKSVDEVEKVICASFNAG